MIDLISKFFPFHYPTGFIIYFEDKGYYITNGESFGTIPLFTRISA